MEATVNQPLVAITLFEPALFEVYQLMENDCMVRFKRKIALQPEMFSEVIWEEMKVTTEYMTYEQFEEYSFETPNLFNFVDKMYHSLNKEVSEILKQSEIPPIKTDYLDPYPTYRDGNEKEDPFYTI